MASPAALVGSLHAAPAPGHLDYSAYATKDLENKAIFYVITHSNAWIAEQDVVVAGADSSYTFLGCSTERHGWELRSNSKWSNGGDVANYSVVYANAARDKATYFFVALSMNAPSDLDHWRSYWFRQKQPGQLKLADGNFYACRRACMDDSTKFCGFADAGGGTKPLILKPVARATTPGLQGRACGQCTAQLHQVRPLVLERQIIGHNGEVL